MEFKNNIYVDPIGERSRGRPRWPDEVIEKDLKALGVRK